MSLSHRDFLEHPFAIVTENAMSVVAALKQFETLRLEPRALTLPHGNCPYLVSMMGACIDVRLALLSELGDLEIPGEVRGLCGTLDITGSMEQLVAHWGSVALQRKPGYARFWLRLHDPRVFMNLSRILDASQLYALMGPISAWRWREVSSDEWFVTTRPQRPTEPVKAWSDGQWNAVFRIELLSRVAREISREIPDLELTSEVYARIDDGLVQAIEHEKLQHPEDQQSFATDAVIYGFGLFDHPSMRRCLEEIRVQGASYLGATMDIDKAALVASMGQSRMMSGLSDKPGQWNAESRENDHA